MSTPLILLVLVVNVCASSLARAESARIQRTGDQKISQTAAREIAEVAAAKRRRTRAQKKIDTQLLYALKQRRGETRGVPSAPIDVNIDERGRVLVDITAIVTPRLISKISNLGADVLSSTEKYHSIRARLALDKLEAVASVDEVRYISPAASGATHAAGAGKAPNVQSIKQ